MPLIYRLILHNTKALCFLKWHPCEKLNQSSKNDCFLPRKTQMFFIFCHVLYFNILKTWKKMILKMAFLRSLKISGSSQVLSPKVTVPQGKNAMWDCVPKILNVDFDSKSCYFVAILYNVFEGICLKNRKKCWEC